MNCEIYVLVNGINVVCPALPAIEGRYMDAGEFGGKDFYAKDGGSPAMDYARWEGGQWIIVSGGVAQYTNPENAQHAWEASGEWLADDAQPAPGPIVTRATGTLQEALDQLYFPA